MLLQRLKEYADTRMSLPPRLYSPTQVRYMIDLDSTGTRAAITDLADSSSRKTKQGKWFLAPQVARSSDISPHLLADDAEHTFGLGADTSKPSRVVRKHQVYREMLDRCATATGESAVLAIQHFLANDPLTHMVLPAAFDRKGAILFRVDDVLATELVAVQRFWAAEHDPALSGAVVMQCIVCNHDRPVLRSMEGKIKGVPGGDATGTMLVSAAERSSWSYGREKSLVSPVCADCSERFTKALNYLLADDASRVRIGASAFVFWTREQVVFSFATLMTDAKPEQVRDLIKSVRSGQRSAVFDTTTFYGVMLTAHGGRVVVRDQVDTTVGEAKHHIVQWFERQSIVDERTGKEAAPLGIYALASATVRDPKDVGAATSQVLLRAALTGGMLPVSLLVQCHRRNVAEQKVTRQRAALMKLVLLSRERHGQERAMVELDATDVRPAYLYGRLLAIFAEIQWAANGSDAHVIRFYGSASSAPAVAFGRLLRSSNFHLAKLRRDNRGAAIALERRLMSVMDSITPDGFKKTLTPEEQTLFGLGYYHQRSATAAERSAGSERKRSREAIGDDTNVADDTDAEEA